MADIAKVTGTLDDAELNFSHSVGTVYKATASIDGSEKGSGNSYRFCWKQHNGNNGCFYFWFMDYSKN